ncbi:hypothetical protein ABBQ38_003713 [Trebouxia sp. C0009 RCD-2024]
MLKSMSWTGHTLHRSASTKDCVFSEDREVVDSGDDQPANNHYDQAIDLDDRDALGLTRVNTLEGGYPTQMTDLENFGVGFAHPNIWAACKLPSQLEILSTGPNLHPLLIRQCSSPSPKPWSDHQRMHMAPRHERAYPPLHLGQITAHLRKDHRIVQSLCSMEQVNTALDWPPTNRLRDS